MATIGMGDIKKNVRLVVGEVPYKVVEFQHVKPGKRCCICSYED